MNYDGVFTTNEFLSLNIPIELFPLSFTFTFGVLMYSINSLTLLTFTLFFGALTHSFTAFPFYLVYFLFRSFHGNMFLEKFRVFIGDSNSEFSIVCTTLLC